MATGFFGPADGASEAPDHWASGSNAPEHEVVAHNIWDAFGPGFCHSQEKCACKPRRREDCAVTVRGPPSSAGAECRVNETLNNATEQSCKEACARDPTCLFGFLDQSGCFLYQECDQSRVPNQKGSNLIRLAKDGGHVVQFNIWDQQGFCGDGNKCACAEPKSGADCAVSVTDHPGYVAGTCRLGNMHALEDCRESCAVDETCRFAYFERGGCHLYRSCTESRVPANVGTNLRRVAWSGDWVEQYDVADAAAEGFCKSGERCTCAEGRGACAHSLRRHPKGPPAGAFPCLWRDVHNIEDCQQLCIADRSCQYAYYEPGGCHLYSLCDESRTPSHVGTNLRRLAFDGVHHHNALGKLGLHTEHRGVHNKHGRRSHHPHALALWHELEGHHFAHHHRGRPGVRSDDEDGGWLTWRLLPWLAVAALFVCAAQGRFGPVVRGLLPPWLRPLRKLSPWAARGGGAGPWRGDTAAEAVELPVPSRRSA